MTHSNRNFALAYILLVALPLFGLAGVLRSGRKLSAPVSVGGVWKISVNPDQLAANPCTRTLAGSTAALTISQSGKSFVLTVPNSGLSSNSGTVEGNTLTASLTPSTASKEPGCSDQQLFLTATVDAKAPPRSLQGMLRVENCQRCSPIEFHATRDEQSKVKETH